MDTNPIYELRSRLRTAAIAGSSLLAEDFRLKRAAEAMKPLEASSPVFYKIGELVHTLLSSDCSNPSEMLLEALTLVDAVICTLGTVTVSDSVVPLENNQDKEKGRGVVNAPYSLLHHLMEAVKLPGGKDYGFVCEIHDKTPELFRDFRVRISLIQALGGSSTTLASMAEEWLIQEGETIIPYLKKGFDPKGKREMVRRVRIMDAVAKEQADGFYKDMLETAEKEVRQALIYALRHRAENIDLLIGMTKSERGKCKQAAIYTLTKIESEKSYIFFKRMMEKKPDTTLQYLRTCTTKWSSKLVADVFHDAITAVDNEEDLKSRTGGEKIYFVQNVLASFIGKGGDEIGACYREALQRRKNNCFMPQLNYDLLSSSSGWQYGHMRFFEESFGMLLFYSLIAVSDESLEVLAIDLYEHSGDQTNGSTINTSFLAAAAITKLLKGENCVMWLQSQAQNKLISKKECKDTINTIRSFVHWENGGYVLRGYYQEDFERKPEVVEQRLQLTGDKNNKDWLFAE